MVKLMILFRHPANLETFENRYNDFLALIERVPEITRRQVISVTGSPQGESPYYRVLEVYFADEAQMRASLNTPAGQEAGSELFKFPKSTFETLFADVYEEAGGRTEIDTNAGA
jgi:uncharacterized protein (TIGR02118 family)